MWRVWGLLGARVRKRLCVECRRGLQTAWVWTSCAELSGSHPGVWILCFSVAGVCARLGGLCSKEGVVAVCQDVESFVLQNSIFLSKQHGPHAWTRCGLAQGDVVPPVGVVCVVHRVMHRASSLSAWACVADVDWRSMQSLLSHLPRSRRGD